MRKSLILFAIIFAYVWGCASGNEYEMISKSDRKAIKSICKCFEPIGSYLEKVMNTKDSLIAVQYLDSIQKKGTAMEDCLEKAKEFENRTNTDEKYINQLVAYIKEYHPKCMPFLAGDKPDSVKIKHQK